MKISLKIIAIMLLIAVPTFAGITNGTFDNDASGWDIYSSGAIEQFPGFYQDLVFFNGGFSGEGDVTFIEPDQDYNAISVSGALYTKFTIEPEYDTLEFDVTLRADSLSSFDPETDKFYAAIFEGPFGVGDIQTYIDNSLYTITTDDFTTNADYFETDWGLTVYNAVETFHASVGLAGLDKNTDYTLCFIYEAQGDEINNIVHLDNVELTSTVPTPSAIFLAVSGVAFVSRYRRK